MAKTNAREALCARINDQAAPETARLIYEGSHGFGTELIRRYRLENGLRILLLVDKSAPVVSYFTWFDVGSRHERPGKTGLAHLFEHLMFNETVSLKAGEFDRKLEQNGAESNAATWVDWTYYYESLPKDRLSLAIKLESDRMANLVLREPQVASEKEVVANERRYRVEDDVEGTMSEILYKEAFRRHAYHWPTIGWMADIEGFVPEDCEAFYRTYYAPNNALVVIVGDLNEADALARLQAAYGPLKSSAIPAEDIHPEPPQLEERRVELEKPTATEKLLIGYHGPAIGDADHVSLTVLNEILFGGRASRLHRALVLDAEIASEVRGWVATFRDPGLWEVHVSARERHTAEEIVPVLDRELSRVRDELVTADELVRATARLELGLVQGMETASGKAEQIGFYEMLLGDPGAAFRRLEMVRRVTLSDVRRVARRYLVDGARTVVRVKPDASSGARPEEGEAA